MVRKDAIREKILGLGADVCGFGGMERFTEAPINFRSTDLFPDCKSVIAVGIALPKGFHYYQIKISLINTIEEASYANTYWNYYN